MHLRDFNDSDCRALAARTNPTSPDTPTPVEAFGILKLHAGGSAQTRGSAKGIACGNPDRAIGHIHRKPGFTFRVAYNCHCAPVPRTTPGPSITMHP